MQALTNEKTVIVTGGGAGMGLATAHAFAREGADVVVAELDPERAEVAAGQIEAAGGSAIGVAVDVADRSGVERLVEKAVSTYGGVDALVNNAGLTLFRPLLEMTEDDWDRILAVNLKASFLTTQAVVASMKERGGGAIVNIASIAGLQGMADHSAYCASKAGLVNLTRALALELGPIGIRVNCICPGVVETPMLRSVTGGLPGTGELPWKSPIGRIGRPEEVAEVSVFFCSERASYVSGAVVTADGGTSSGPG
jgi:NAD(P)-dependent dehydrogenase (short-subunit alcohol dehydrogenase family)